jgi:hypothetical protein
LNRKLKKPSSDTIARIRAVADRKLSAAEVEASLGVPIGEEERAEVLSLVAWFCRRYPLPAERLAYVRRAYRRWMASQQR